MNHAAIVLCGGKSSRMGHDKALLPFGHELMLQRIVRLMSEVIPPPQIVVVAAVDQQLPSLHQSLIITRDKRAGRGPLEGIAAGLEALPQFTDVVFAASCDVPLLAPPFISRIFELLGNHEIAVPFDGQHYHPLAAAYRPSVLPFVLQLLDSDQLSPRRLFDLVPTKIVDVELLKAVDPQLLTLNNVNHPDEYAAALKRYGQEL